MNELYHYGVKGMKWGVRKEKFRQTVNKTMGSFLGIENKYLNKALRSSGKLRKSYFNMQTLGVKPGKHGSYKYKHGDKETYNKQRYAATKAKKYAEEFLKKYEKQPMSYLESINAQRGAAIGTGIGIAVPVILPLWATIPAGYYIGSHIGGSSVKHSYDEIMHYGVKGMRWRQHKYRDDDNSSSWLTSLGESLRNAANAEQSAADRTMQFADVVQNQFSNGRYLAALQTARTAYTTDNEVRTIVNQRISNMLSNMEKSDSWIDRFTGRAGRTAHNAIINLTGGEQASRRGTRAEVEAYEREMNDQTRSTKRSRASSKASKKRIRTIARNVKEAIQ